MTKQELIELFTATGRYQFTGQTGDNIKFYDTELDSHTIIPANSTQKQIINFFEDEAAKKAKKEYSEEFQKEFRKLIGCDCKCD